jgi:signal transduction histidine kinase
VSELGRVVDAHDRMDAILADMLALARDGERTVSPTAVDLDAVAEEAWAMVVTDDATLTVTTGVTLYADRGRLKTLFENLFRNSVEHGSTDSRTQAGDSVEHGSADCRPTADGSVDVTVGRLDDESGFYVEDSGHGIPPEIRERVFEAAFTTGGGSGLGLAIVRAAADAHGWSHTLTESATGGARFEFRNVTFVDGD